MSLYRCPWSFLDRSGWWLGKLDGKVALERALGFLELQDLIEDLPQEESPANIVWAGHWDFYPPVLRPPDL